MLSAIADFIETFDETCIRRDELIRRFGRSSVADRVKRSLSRCEPAHRCGCIWCPVCARTYRAWISSQVLALVQTGVRATIVVLNLREVAAEALTEVNIGKTLDLLRKDMTRCGFQALIGNLEAAYKPERKAWCIHVHLVVFGDVTEPLAALRAMFRARGVRRAVHDTPVTAPIRQISYQFKFVTYYRFRSNRKAYPLVRAQLDQLIEWTANIKSTDFLFLIGFQRRGSIVGGPFFNRLVQKRVRRRGDVATWRIDR